MKPIVIYILIFFLFSFIFCNGKQFSYYENPIISDSINILGYRNVNDSLPIVTIITKKIDGYDKEFIKCCKTVPCKQITLNDSLMTVDNNNSIIPVFLPFMKNITYSSTKQNIKWVLNVKRINYTSVLFSFSKIFGSSDSISHSGRLVLPCSFYMGEETNKDENGEVYQVFQYLDTADKKSIGIRISEEKATFYYFTTDKKLNIEESPTLLKKQHAEQ